MAVLNRGVEFLWNEEATGAGGASPFAVIGAQVNVAVHISVDGATTIGFEAAYSENRSAGRNAVPDSTHAHVLYQRDGSAPLTISIAQAGKVTIDLSEFTPNFLRITSSNDVTATAVVEVVG